VTTLNFKHLRYFWMVGKTGSIARAAERLHLTPQSISGQLSEFENALGVQLFRPSGRNRELTDTGRRMLAYAQEIFAIGDDMLDMLRDQESQKAVPFRVGIADCVTKSIAYRLVEPALKYGERVRLVCREGRLTSLVADLAIHRLDMIIADRPMSANLNVRGYSHLLGESGLTVFGTQSLAKKMAADFPASLENAPFLLPGEDVAIRPKLIEWFEKQDLRPNIVGEFDDSALMKAFGQAGAGFFAGPTAIAAHVSEQYQVVAIGRIDSVVEQLYAITTERRITHPAVVAISKAARENVFAGGMA
jgi:LysR family transcriptional regulator, transcriptional activator of nhaA